jgi:hypothetical protein
MGAAAGNPSPRTIATQEVPMRRFLSSFLTAVLAAAGVLLLGPDALLGPNDALAAVIDLA